MRLEDWLRDSGITQEAFAELIGRAPATVSRLVNGVNPPNWRTVQKIEAVTAGQVTRNDFEGAAA